MIAIASIFAGCTTTTNTPTPTPVPTAVPTQTPAQAKTFDESNNGQTVPVKKGDTVVIKLNENPTTGYMWNTTLTPGITSAAANGTYVQNQTPAGMVGVGGIRTWNLTITDNGTQTFRGVYMRSWEPVTGNETVFVMNFAAA